MQKHIVEAISEDCVWIRGLIDGNPFVMLVEDDQDIDGIEFSRVTKLYVDAKDDAEALISYERDWDQRPSNPEQQSMLNALLCLAAKLPKQEVWVKSFRKLRYFVVTEDSVLEAAPYDRS